MGAIKESMQRFALEQALNYLEGDPQESLPRLMELVDRYTPADWYAGQRSAVRRAIAEKNNWYELILRLYALDPEVRRVFSRNFLYNASLRGSAIQHEAEEREDCNIPWAILLDPTSACNLRCTGCWAAEYGHALNLSSEEIDSIIRQGKVLGVYMYIYTGGEPMVRAKDLVRLGELHPDCEFLFFTNGTLIDEDFCHELRRVKNLVPAISLEGFAEANDSRRGAGISEKVSAAMALLKAHKLPFGISTCYTSRNASDVASEEYFDLLIESGALFVWYFHYMPVGVSATTELLPSPEQRELIYNSLRAYRKTKPIFSIDFQNDAEYIGGCIAGGRNYLHINAKGDVEPCVFIHYSNCNIRETSLLEALKSPLFMAYRRRHPFNENMLQPCPMLENPALLREMVAQSGARSTDYESPESAEALCAKTRPYAESWAPTAERLWSGSGCAGCKGCEGKAEILESAI